MKKTFNKLESSSCDRSATEKQHAKRLPLKKRRKRFFLGKRFLTAFVASLLCILTFYIGFWIFAAVCNSNVQWENIPSPSDETIQSDMEIPIGPYGDGFLTNLGQYEEYIYPIGDKRDAFLRLISIKTPLKRHDIPSDLVTLPATMTRNGETCSLALYAAKALEAMFLEMDAVGIERTDPTTGLSLFVQIGYRSYDEQETLFDREVERQIRKDPTLSTDMAMEIASAIVDKPGTNEFQSGLAVAFSFGGAISPSFADTEVFAWLSDNAWKFGYILRYPEGKEDETGIAFRPYHFRYVGRAHASLMVEHGLCLEEYLQVVNLH